MLHVVVIVEQSAKAKSSSCCYRPVTEVSCYQDLLSILIANPSKGSILTDRPLVVDRPLNHRVL